MEKGNVKEPPSLSPQVEAGNSVKYDYSAQDVADAFLKQYYNILQAAPKEAHKFYHDQSIRAHPSADGSMKSVTTMKDIDHEIMASNVKEWNPDLSTVHAQDSVMQSVIVGVTGCLTDKDNVTRKFAQTFLLAIQEGGGFYVHNDFLHFIEISTISETSPPIDDAAAALSNLQVNGTAKDSSSKNVKSTSEEEDVNIGSKVTDSSNGKNTHEAEPKKKTQPSVWLPVKNMQANPKRISYASIVAKEGSAASTLQASSDAVVTPKPSILGVPKASVHPGKPSAFSANDPPENSEIKAIRVKDLPPKMTEESLLEYVKIFGPVKQKNIQIKEYSEDGYRYAFVEFDNPKAAHSAVEARYIQFEDRESEIQYKRSSNQGHHFWGKPQNGRGGFRKDNFYGRDGDARSSGSWGQRYSEHESGGRYSGHNRDFDYNRRNRNFQDQAYNFN